MRALENKPELGARVWLWEAYLDLASCALPTFGNPARIPWTAIRDWAQHYGLDEDNFALLDFVIRKMEQVAIEHHKKNTPRR